MSVHFDVVSKAQQFRPLFNKKRPARQQQSVFSTLNEMRKLQCLYIAIFKEFNILPWQFWLFKGFGEFSWQNCHRQQTPTSGYRTNFQYKLLK